MYQALSGRLPHEAPSIPALLFAIVEKTPTSLRDLRPDLPADLVAIVERAMAKDRNARFPDADAMRRALAPWSGLPASVPPPTSATAATVASGNIAPYDPATPIVVHHTPAPAKVASSTPSSADAPRARSASPLTLIALVLVVGMIATASVFIVSILKKSDDRREGSVAPASSSLAMTSTSSTLVAMADPSASGATATASTMTSTTATTNHVHVAPSATPTESASASAPPPVPAATHKRYGGKTGYMSMGDFEFCHCDYPAFRADLATREAAINACFATSEHEAPIHENPDYEFSVSENGAISVRKAADGAPNLDRCLTGVVSSITIKKTSSGSGSFKMGFRGECTRGWSNHCD